MSRSEFLAPMMARARPCARVAALLALALAGGCRRPASDRQQTSAPDTAQQPAAREALACTLITIPELQQITGWKDISLASPTEDYRGYSRCDWRHGGLVSFLAIVANEHGDFEDYRKVPGSVPVSGVGEAAVWNPDTRRLGVKVSPGTISVNFLAGVARKEWAEEMARTVIRAMHRTGKATTPPPATTSAAASGASSSTPQ